MITQENIESMLSEFSAMCDRLSSNEDKKKNIEELRARAFEREPHLMTFIAMLASRLVSHNNVDLALQLTPYIIDLFHRQIESDKMAKEFN